jgi:hypothetical protein
MATEERWESWAKVELLGHRVRYGLVSEEILFGTPQIKIIIPTEPLPLVEYYSPAAMFALIPMSEQLIRNHLNPPRLAIPAPLVDPWPELSDEDDDEDDEAMMVPYDPDDSYDPDESERKLIAAREEERDR